MKKLLLLLLIFIDFQLYAQIKVDVIYLKDGSIIKGLIIEQNEQIIKIKTFCDNTLVFSTENIVEQKKEKYEPFKPLKKTGYYNYTSMGGLIGSESDAKTTNFSILMEHNYRANNYISVGAVTGIEWFNTSVAPLGLNLKLILPASEKMFYYLGNSAGYSVALEEVVEENYIIKETKGGYFYNTELGVVFPSIGNAHVYFALGFRYQDLSYVREDWWLDEVERKTTYNRFSLKIGVCLH